MSSPKLPCFHLIVEHLSRPNEGSRPLHALKPLSDVLGKASSHPIPTPNPRAEIAERLGMALPIPWARIWLSYAGLEERHEESCFVVEPVQMVAGMNTIAMRPLPRPLNALQLQEFVAVLQPILATDGAQFENVQGQCLLRFPKVTDVHTTPLDEAGQRDLRDCLPSGKDSGWIKRLMTECQMVLHDLSSYPALADSGVNGVWLWGNSSLAPPTLTVGVHTHDLWLKALMFVMKPPNPELTPFSIWHGATHDTEFEDLLTSKVHDLWRGRLNTLSISFWRESEPGHIWHIKRHHLLRFWSRPVKIEG